jgi:O-antigen/teichoic acid export membrane protein
MHVIAVISIMANLALFIVSKEFLVLVLGHGTEKWLPALVTLKIFCLYGIFRSLLEPVGSIMLAIGRTDILFKAALLAAILEISFLYPVLRFWGIEGVAILVTLSYLSQFFVFMPCLKTELNLQPLEIVSAIKPAAVAGIIVLICVEISTLNIDMSLAILSSSLKLITSMLGFVCIYGVISKWRLVKEVKLFMSA